MSAVQFLSKGAACKVAACPALRGRKALLLRPSLRVCHRRAPATHCTTTTSPHMHWACHRLQTLNNPYQLNQLPPGLADAVRTGNINKLQVGGGWFLLGITIGC